MRASARSWLRRNPRCGRTGPRGRPAELGHGVERLRVGCAFGAGQGAFGVANVAIVQGAVYDAVNAIDRRARPYLRAPHAKRVQIGRAAGLRWLMTRVTCCSCDRYGGCRCPKDRTSAR